MDVSAGRQGGHPAAPGVGAVRLLAPGYDGARRRAQVNQAPHQVFRLTGYSKARAELHDRENPPKIRRLPSNGIGLVCGLRRLSFITFAIAASRVALSGHSIHEKTTTSSSFACTARRKSVSLPSFTSSPQHSRTRVAPCSMKTESVRLACSMNFCLFCLGTAITNPSM